MVNFQSLDFSSIHRTDSVYVTCTSIPGDRGNMLLVCVIHYSFDILFIIRFTGGNRNASHQDVYSILHILTVTGYKLYLVSEIHHILTVGCPTYFSVASSPSKEIFKAFALYGNHTSIACNAAKFMITLNKEALHSYFIPCPR